VIFLSLYWGYYALHSRELVQQDVRFLGLNLFLSRKKVSKEFRSGMCSQKSLVSKEFRSGDVFALWMRIWRKKSLYWSPKKKV